MNCIGNLKLGLKGRQDIAGVKPRRACCRAKKLFALHKKVAKRLNKIRDWL